VVAVDRVVVLAVVPPIVRVPVPDHVPLVPAIVWAILPAGLKFVLATLTVPLLVKDDPAATRVEFPLPPLMVPSISGALLIVSVLSLSILRLALEGSEKPLLAVRSDWSVTIPPVYYL
jgi:hypothetical protein